MKKIIFGSSAYNREHYLNYPSIVITLPIYKKTIEDLIGLTEDQKNILKKKPTELTKKEKEQLENLRIKDDKFILKLIQDYEAELIKKNYFDKKIFKRKTEYKKNNDELTYVKHLKNLIKPSEEKTYTPKTSEELSLTHRANDFLTEFNRLRLDALMPRGFMNALAVSQFDSTNLDILIQSTNNLGYQLSVYVYLFRLSLNTSLILKHTFLTSHEFFNKQNISQFDRFWVQFKLRASQTMNDAFWLPGNFFSISFSMLFGDFVVMGLFFWDIVVSIWLERMTQKTLEDFQKNILQKFKFENENHQLLDNFEKHFNKHSTNLLYQYKKDKFGSILYLISFVPYVMGDIFPEFAFALYLTSFFMYVTLDIFKKHSGDFYTLIYSDNGYQKLESLSKILAYLSAVAIIGACLFMVTEALIPLMINQVPMIGILMISIMITGLLSFIPKMIIQFYINPILAHYSSSNDTINPSLENDLDKESLPLLNHMNKN